MLSLLRRRKTLLVATLAALAAAAYAVFALANRVAVADVQSIGGNRVLVPPAEMDIVRATWSIDAERSLVTDVDLLIFPNSPVWKLKLFEFFVQVSCLDPGPDGTEGTADDVEFICSTGRAREVLPSHWIGLRPLRIDLTKPINPETTEIHDLSFIVTNLNPVPQGPPALFGGAMPPQVELGPGQTKVIEAVVHGVRGVPVGTQVEFAIENLPQGVEASFFDAVVELRPMGPMRVPHAMTQLRLTASGEAQIGEQDSILVARGAGMEDRSLIEIEIVPLELAGSP